MDAHPSSGWRHHLRATFRPLVLPEFWAAHMGRAGNKKPLGSPLRGTVLGPSGRPTARVWRALDWSEEGGGLRLRGLEGLGWLGGIAATDHQLEPLVTALTALGLLDHIQEGQRP